MTVDSTYNLVPATRMPTLNKAALMICASLVMVGCGASPGSESASNNSWQENSIKPATYERCTTVDTLPAGQHMVTSWKTAPTDALITHPITSLSVRQSFAPHWSGELVRLRLSNRYSEMPVTIENMHIALEAIPGEAQMVVDSECLLTFGDSNRVTIGPGESVYTDTIAYPIRSFERVGISFFAPEATIQITRHLNANEYLYNSYPGDYAADPSPDMYQQVPDGYASNFLAIEALEVAAPTQVATLVTVGDSITDGSGSTTGGLNGEADSMTATDQRYPNHLQQLINEAGLPISVANAGIGGNELLTDGWLPQFGVSVLGRLDYDVLAVTAATHVLAMVGTNDLGNPHAGQNASGEDLIVGLTELVTRVQAAGMKIILGTIPPAEGTIVDGLPGSSALPIGIELLHGTAAARLGRDTVNEWIREQEMADGIVDFDACLEDPERPGYMAPEYNSGDNLHPNPAGYAAMAQCIDLTLFSN